MNIITIKGLTACVDKEELDSFLYWTSHYNRSEDLKIYINKQSCFLCQITERASTSCECTLPETAGCCNRAFGHMTRIRQVVCDASCDLFGEGGGMSSVFSNVPMELDGTFRTPFPSVPSQICPSPIGPSTFLLYVV